MPFYDKALENMINSQIDLYVAILEGAPPLVEGTDENEAIYTGYARQLCVDWSTHLDGTGWYISNTSAIVFPVVTAAPITMQWWGLYQTAVGGGLYAAGPVRNLSGVAIPQLLLVGDQARFNADTLKFRAGA